MMTGHRPTFRLWLRASINALHLRDPLCSAAQGLQIGEAKPWRGTLISAAVDVSVLAIPPHETVARLLATLKTNQDVNIRKMSIDAISLLVCRRFGQNDGQEASVRALETSWNLGQKRKSRGLDCGRDRQRQARRASTGRKSAGRPRHRYSPAKEPPRRAGPAAPGGFGHGVPCPLGQFPDQDSFAYARKVLGDESYVRRFAILTIVRDNEIDLRAECQARFLAWLKGEKNVESLRHLVEAAAGFNFIGVVPIL